MTRLTVIKDWKPFLSWQEHCAGGGSDLSCRCDSVSCASAPPLSSGLTDHCCIQPQTQLTRIELLYAPSMVRSFQCHLYSAKSQRALSPGTSHSRVELLTWAIKEKRVNPVATGVREKNSLLPVRNLEQNQHQLLIIISSSSSSSSKNNNYNNSNDDYFWISCMRYFLPLYSLTLFVSCKCKVNLCLANRPVRACLHKYDTHKSHKKIHKHRYNQNVECRTIKIG